MKDIVKKVRYVEESDLLVKGASETTENKKKRIKSWIS